MGEPDCWLSWESVVKARNTVPRGRARRFEAWPNAQRSPLFPAFQGQSVIL